MQKLIVMQRDTKEQLMEAVKKNILERSDHHSGSSRVTSLSVLEQTKEGLVKANETGIYFEAWVIVEVPDNKEKLYEMAAGFES